MSEKNPFENTLDLSMMDIQSINSMLYKIYDLEENAENEYVRKNYRASRIKVYYALCKRLYGDFDLFVFFYEKEKVPYVDKNLMAYIFSKEKIAIKYLEKHKRDNIVIYKVKRKNIIRLLSDFRYFGINKFILDAESNPISVKCRDIAVFENTKIETPVISGEIYTEVFRCNSSEDFFDNESESVKSADDIKREEILDELKNINESIKKQNSIIEQYKYSFFGYGMKRKKEAKNNLVILRRKLNKYKMKERELYEF